MLKNTELQSRVYIILSLFLQQIITFLKKFLTPAQESIVKTLYVCL